MTSSLLLLAASIATVTLGPTDVAVGPDQPYELVVCLRFSETPFLTPLFVDSVADQVQDQLTNSFGPLANTRVLLKDHWLLDPKVVSGVDDPALTPDLLIRQQEQAKVFLVSVEYRDGVYEVAWRQMDGRMQYVGSARSRSTPDRQWVARIICLAVRNHFSPVAEVVPVKGSQWSVNLQFQGQKWGSHLSQTLGEDCILQPFWVVRQRGDRLVHVPISGTLLRVHSEGVRREVSVVSNRSNPWQKTARVAGFRAIKLNTQQGRLRLRLVDARSETPAPGCTVLVNHESFDRDETDRSFGDVDRQGYVLSKDVFRHIAFVKISLGGGSMIKMPIAITDDLAAIVCKVPLDKAADKKDSWLRRLRFVVQDLRTMHAMLDTRFREITSLRGEKRYEPALEKARAVLAEVRELRGTASLHVSSLRDDSEENGMQSSQPLNWATDQVARIEDREGTLAKVIEGLEAAIARRDQNNQYVACLETARDAEKACDFESAISLYKEALETQPGEHPETQQHLDRLVEDWRIKGGDHQVARDYVYKQWAEAELTQLRSKLSEAIRAFITLKSYDDHLTSTKLLKSTSDHLIDLSGLISSLSPTVTTEADRAELKEYSDFNVQLGEFNDEIAQYLKQRSEPPPAAGGTSPAPATPTEQPAETAPPTEQLPPAQPGTTAPPTGTDQFGGEEEEEPPLAPS